MSLYLLNLSVDAIDPKSKYVAEDLSFNDQESIVEIVVEQFLGFENAIKEYDDNDTEDHSGKVQVKLDWFTRSLLFNNLYSVNDNEGESSFPTHFCKESLGYFQVDTPPPKV